jgi:outer membrane biosynthesis protein TonB
MPGEAPSTGSDVATVSTEGIEFPFPEYLQNIVSQVLRRWQRPLQNTPLEAEVGFMVHRDGSVTDLQFVKRSGNFAFDLEAQGAIEEAGRFKAFGVLPEGWVPDVLFVRFYFSGQRQ